VTHGCVSRESLPLTQQGSCRPAAANDAPQLDERRGTCGDQWPCGRSEDASIARARRTSSKACALGASAAASCASRPRAWAPVGAAQRLRPARVSKPSIISSLPAREHVSCSPSERSVGDAERRMGIDRRGTGSERVVVGVPMGRTHEPDDGTSPSVGRRRERCSITKSANVNLYEKGRVSGAALTHSTV